MRSRPPWLFSVALPGIAMAVVLFIGVTGCATLEPKRFDVNESSLNFIEITWLSTNQPMKFTRISLLGNGNILLRRGASPRVLDSFAADLEHPDWNDYHEQTCMLTAREMHQIFQAFVNRGIYDEEPKPLPGTPKLPMAKIFGRLNTKDFFRHTIDPDLLEIVTSLLTLIDEANRPPPLNAR
jgi:hypothetical protein